MLKRLIVGLVLGTVIGAALAAILVQALGMPLFANASFAYVAAAVTGIVTGLVAGKPIWAAGGKIEAGLKAFFGVLLALGGMFVLRTWVNVEVDLNLLKAGAGPLGSLPAAALPILAAVLAGFYELDNSPEDPAKSNGAASRDKARAGNKVRVGEAGEATTLGDDLEEPVSRTKNAKNEGR